jgi:lysophospholipase L1-like esterase
MNLLDRDDFHTLLTGCIRTELSASGLLLHRLTRKQVSYFDSTSEALGIRARCNAGIQLKIITDSPTLQLTGRIKAGARQYAGIDVNVDGMHVGALRTDASPETRAMVLFDSQSRRCRQITVTFPQSAILELDAIEVDDHSQVSAAEPAPTKYLAIGDSITQGMDARGPSSAYATQLSHMLNMELLNIGVGGHVFDPAALDDDLPYKPDIVTVAYGTNDWSREISREQITDTVTSYLAHLIETVARSAQVYVLTPIWRATGDDVKVGGTLSEFSAAIGAAAAALPRVTVVDGMTLVPHVPDLLIDGTHPTDEGFLHYAINLCRALGCRLRPE